MRRREPDEFSRDDKQLARLLLQNVPGDSGGHGHREWVKLYLRCMRSLPGSKRYRQLRGLLVR